MKPTKNRFYLSLLMIAMISVISVFGLSDGFKGAKDMRLGIDIRGGVEAVFQPADLDRKPTQQELESAREIMDLRLDSNNITDRVVTIDKDGGYLVVQFPWKSGETSFNPEEAIMELGEMAQLTFQDGNGNVLLEGKHIVSTSPDRSANGAYVNYKVNLEFTKEGAKLFAKATKEMIGKPIYIFMDDIEISSPIVNSEITSGKCEITGLESFDIAKELSEKINAGALPFGLETSSFQTISPTLGNMALTIMIVAGLIAFLLVCIFMIINYRLPGVIACFTLTLQMALQLLIISVPQFTLTLPGIAGIILSLGMSVDANVIISERISEELAKGYAITTAVKNGYKKAFSSVLDGNLTTAIVAVILMIFGSGSMLSFGYTLLSGMIINVFVGVTISKYMLLSSLQIGGLRKEKYFHRFKERKAIRFYQHKWVYALISGGALLVGIISFMMNGVSLDTQFTGGVVLQLSLDGECSTSEIEQITEDIVHRPVTAQITNDFTTEQKHISITMAGEDGITPQQQKSIVDQINESMKDGSVGLETTFSVEPFIGEKALKDAKIAIILSSIFIVIYVWIRFQSMSGLTAGITGLIALIHDVLVVLFVFIIARIPLNDAFVAVVLTIIGYSINDTIVLYDRIRENHQLDSKKQVVPLVDESMTQVLSRSVNSSITTGICVLCILVASLLFHMDSITKFALPMFFGIISGCYSSICIASTLWAMKKKRTEKENQHEKDKNNMYTRASDGPGGDIT